jgi:autotransporter-associated beta strand protein
MKTIVALLVTGLCLSAAAGTHTWTGGGTNGLWSNTANWSGGVPGNETPLHLVFPANAARKTMTNNLAGLDVDSVRFEGGTWNVYGTGADPSLALRALTGGVPYNIGVTSGSVTFTFGVPLALTANNVFFQNAGATLTVAGWLSGSGGVTKRGNGDMYLTGVGNHTYTGSTFVEAGTLSLNRSFPPVSYIAIPGALFIGTDIATNPPATVKLLADEQIATNTPVTIRPSGRLWLQNHTQTFGPLVLNSGELDTGTNGLARLNANLASTNQLFTPGHLKGRLDLGNSPRSFRVENYMLLVAARIEGQTNATLQKLGAETLYLEASNAYSGLTLISQGALAAKHSKALGTTNVGTVVSNGASLLLMGGLTIGEPLVLNGYDDILGSLRGALCSFGTNICLGQIALASDTYIATQLPTDTLTIYSLMTGAGGWEKGGPGWVTVGGMIQTNTYAGITRVRQGKLILDRFAAPGARPIPGALEIGVPGDSVPAIVEIRKHMQWNDTATITLGPLGQLKLIDGIEFIESLMGSGTVSLSTNTQIVLGYYNNSDSVFDGTLSGGVSNQFNLNKFGQGRVDLGGTNLLAGMININEGTLRINSAQPTARVVVASPATLGGTGSVARITLQQTATLAPGAPFGTLRAGVITNAGAFDLDLEMSGALSAVSHDRLELDTVPDLSQAYLHVAITNFSATNLQEFVIVKNNTGLPVLAPFSGLPEGETVYSTDNTARFKITYVGGDGNDVVLRLFDHVQAAQLGGAIIGPNGLILSATGTPGIQYEVEASEDLSDPDSWNNIGYANANGVGLLQFVDADASYYPRRFYRFVAP